MQNLKQFFSVRMISFFVAMIAASIVGYMVLADGVFYNGANGSVSVTNKSVVINDANGDKMSVAVDISFAASGTNSKFTLPAGTSDTSIDVGIYNYDVNKVWINQSFSVPLASEQISLKLAQNIDKKDYYRTYPNANASGNLVKVLIYGGVSKKLYYESDAFKLFDYKQPFTIESASPMVINAGDKFIIQGSGFMLENIKGVYMGELGLSYSILSENQIEAQVPSTIIGTGKYVVHIISKDELFDVYLPSELSIVKMSITSVAPLSPLKDTNITIKGIGFVASKIKAVYIGSIMVPYTWVSPTEISMIIPKDFINGAYNITIEDTELTKYTSPNKITIANMNITSIDPVELIKNAKGDAYFYINGAGFFKDNVSKVYVGTTEMNLELVNDTKIKVFVPAEFVANTYEIEILTNENLRIFASEYLVVKDAIVADESKKSNSTGSTSFNKFVSKSYKGIVPKCNITGSLNESGDDFAEPCGFTALIELINNVINFLLVWFATPLAAVILAYAGFTYLTSGGSAEKATKAKHMLTSMIMGYVIALAAWLIIKTILSAVGFEGAFNLLG